MSQRTFRYEGTGDPVPIRGASGLALPLGADCYGPWGNYHYTGARIARPHLDPLKALAMFADSEGWGGFAFALRHRASYRTFALSDPNRIVIDFRQQPADVQPAAYDIASVVDELGQPVGHEPGLRLCARLRLGCCHAKISRARRTSPCMVSTRASMPSNFTIPRRRPTKATSTSTP